MQKQNYFSTLDAMATPISKHRDMPEVQLRGMITHAQKEFKYLDHTSDEALFGLARLMVTNDFVVDRQVTPVRSSLEFLRKIGPTAEPAVQKIHERDFVFAIKMFGMLVREKNGLLEFLPGNRWIDDIDTEGKPAVKIEIDNEKTGREIELDISDVKKHRKIHERRIEAATNRLLRIHRDVSLAKVLGALIQSGMKIGEARDVLRQDHVVKDHEYVRIRGYALELGLLDTRSRRKNTRVTLDPDVAAYVVELSKVKGRLHSRTPTQTVNQALRDLHLLTKKEHLSAVPKTDAESD